MSHPLKAPVDWNPIPALAGCILDVIIGVIPFDHRWWQTPRMCHGQKRASHPRLGCLNKDFMSLLRVRNIVEYARACDVLSELIGVVPMSGKLMGWCQSLHAWEPLMRAWGLLRCGLVVSVGWVEYYYGVKGTTKGFPKASKGP